MRSANSEGWVDNLQASRNALCGVVAAGNRGAGGADAQARIAIHTRLAHPFGQSQRIFMPLQEEARRRHR